VNNEGQPFTNFVVDINHFCEITDWIPGRDLSAAITATAEFYRWAGANSLIVGEV